MPREVFLLPTIITDPATDKFKGKWRAKYVDATGIVGHACLCCSRNDWRLVMVEGPQAVLDAIAANTDATRLATEANLNSPVTVSQANVGKVIFEGMGIPHTFFMAGDTRKQILRKIGGYFMFSRRMEGKFGSGWKARAVGHGVTLDSTWNTFPQVLKDELVAIRDDKGWGNLGITGSSTTREILHLISAKYSGVDMNLNGVTI